MSQSRTTMKPVSQIIETFTKELVQNLVAFGIVDAEHKTLVEYLTEDHIRYHVREIAESAKNTSLIDLKQKSYEMGRV